ncbi:MAG: anthranilate phosphoribosyltransferase [Candidatus Nitrosotenuis sp.]|uniref:Anthranilate phosphoribosyltransferase n=1 Tax=Candidatus Nitrosotenuis uzonensis TaxID=1407055 RepID=A0A812F5A5_9ARCH|nr:anthranilate phosphoribosyltransferase [Candidatus Nitrosotenuis uzonensis]MCA2003384.1 anthranilate phosphoribosyltransferase [Candidatus Nitrosotenuis sp.]CAE6498928.1 Anthranilate phosphoribosyltransferase [Candidatus Nitrosotenuis uzonensis]
MITDTIAKLQSGQDLGLDETMEAMNDILTEGTPDKQKAEFLRFLAKKGETNDELFAMLSKMDELCIHIEPKCSGTIIDMCGTGGDRLSTFNISTTASFVVAASGGYVAKHGNRSVSGISGSADIFEYFGIDLDAHPEKIKSMIESDRIAFLFAQKFHPAMKYVAAARKILGTRTAFNLLGPLCNPARVKNQLIGVFSEELLRRIVFLLQRRGAQSIMTVHSGDGLDELSTGAKNKICFLQNGKITDILLDPQQLGLQRATLSDLQISSKQHAIKAFLSVLDGTANRSMSEIVMLNAAGGLVVGNIAKDFGEGLEIARNALQSGAAYKFFVKYVTKYGNIDKIGEVQEA